MAPLNIDVWSDIACPWCYVGKRRLEAALQQFANAAAIRVNWRAFELDPSAPPVFDQSVSYVERLARKYGTTCDGAQQMIDRMTEVAQADGLTFDFDRIQPGNTFSAHRLLHLARHRDNQDALKERFLSAYMTEGLPIGDHDALIRLASEAGLNEEEASDVLSSGAYADEVRADEAEAHRLGVTGVPFFVIGRYAVSGAQPAGLLSEVLDKAWQEAAPPPERIVAEGAACGPGGCD